MFRLFFCNKQCYFNPWGTIRAFGATSSSLSICLYTYMKDGFLLEDLKVVMSEFVFNVFKEKIRGIFLFRDDAEVKA